MNDRSALPLAVPELMTPVSAQVSALVPTPDALDAVASDDAASSVLPVPALEAQAATLDDWRRRGAERLDPVRFCRLEGLVRRATQQAGAPRVLLEARVAALIAEFETAHAAVFDQAGERGALRQARPLSSPTSTVAAAPATKALGKTEASPSQDAARQAVGTEASALALLRSLVAQLEAHAAERPAAAAPTEREPGELKAVSQFRDTWARVHTERLLNHAESLVPPQAGPLNTERLIHRTLQTLHELSPAYLQHFLAHAETLTWLERAQTPPVRAPLDSPRPVARKAGGSKR